MCPQDWEVPDSRAAHEADRREQATSAELNHEANWLGCQKARRENCLSQKDRQTGWQHDALEPMLAVAVSLGVRQTDC